LCRAPAASLPLDSTRALTLHPIPPPVSPPDLVALHTLFDRNLARGLALAEGGGVTRFVGSTSGRTVYQVRAGGGGGGHGRGSSARSDHGGHHPAAHTTFPSHYCDCDAFYFDVVHRGDAAACKHQLAARLAACFPGGGGEGSGNNNNSLAGQVRLPDDVLARLLIAG
jgi:hypothetical protein